MGLNNQWVPALPIKDHDTNVKLVEKLTDILKLWEDYRKHCILCAMVGETELEQNGKIPRHHRCST